MAQTRFYFRFSCVWFSSVILNLIIEYVVHRHAASTNCLDVVQNIKFVLVSCGLHGVLVI